MRLLTTSEAAAYLRLKERKLYELVAEGAIPCSKITGKWLFPQVDLDHWLAASLVRPKHLRLRTMMPIMGGSHDPLLEWALRESGCGLASLAEGSEAGLARFADGGVVACAIHLHTIAEAGDPNVGALRDRGAFHDAVLVAFARREQGLLVASGNPLRIGGLPDAVAQGARMAMRPKGAGAQLLLVALLSRNGLSLSSLRAVDPVCPTGPDIAQAIRAGRADCGIATRAVAHTAGLDFVPLVWEVFDIAVRQRAYFQPAMQALIAFQRTPAFAKRADELTGYDVSAAGSIRYAPE